MTNEELLSRTWQSVHKYLVEKNGMTNQDANAEITEMLQKSLPIAKLGEHYGGTNKEQIRVLRSIKKSYKKQDMK
jgi:hypothetical protein